jgi:hypothetical protein
MPIEGDFGLAIRQAQLMMAERMLRAALYFQTAHKQNLNTPNSGVRHRRTRNTAAGKKGSSYTTYDNPSRPGEFPHKITGQGQAGVMYGPETPEEVIDKTDMVVRIGHRAFMGGDEFRKGRTASGGGFNYMVHLERQMDRLGYMKTADMVRSQMAATVLGHG